MGGQQPATIYLTRLRDPADFGRSIQKIGSPRTERVRINQPKLQWWASAAKPGSNANMFVLGGHNITALVYPMQASWQVEPHPVPNTDNLSVDWLDQNVFASGARSGDVFLRDTRSNGMSARFKFLGAINHVKKLDEHKIVVAGMNDNVSLYRLELSSPI